MVLLGANSSNQRMIMVRKGKLKPGMEVRNRISGMFGIVRGRNGELLPSHSCCVAVAVRNRTGKHKGKSSYPYWNLENLDLVKKAT